MIFVVCYLPFKKLVSPRLAVVRKIKDMKHVMFLLQHSLPTGLDDAFQAQRLMVFLPAISDQNRVCLGERAVLKFCNRELFMNPDSGMGDEVAAYRGLR